MSGISLARLDIHNAQRKGSRRDDTWISVLSGTTTTDKSMLRSPKTIGTCIFKCLPIRCPISEASYILLLDVLKRKVSNLGRPGMTRDTHRHIPPDFARGARLMTHSVYGRAL